MWPEPVERAIRRHPRVADVAVAGTPDPEWGQVVTAYVVPAGTQAPTLDDLRRAVREVLPAYCAPRLLHVVEAIPTTPLGKATTTVAAASTHILSQLIAGSPSLRRSGITTASGSAARCSGVSPPHTPSRSPDRSAWARQRQRIEQRPHTSTALSYRSGSNHHDES